MKNKMRWHHSLRYRIVLMMAGALLLICTTIIGFNLHIYKVMDRQAEQTTISTLEFYTEEVEFSLENIESFLVNKCLEQDMIRKIKEPRKELDRYLTIGEVQELFETSMDSYHLMDGLFLYDRENSIYIGKGAPEGGEDYASLMNGAMSGLIEKFETAAKENGNEWFSTQICEEYFLVKMFEVQDVYVGSWVRAESILEKLQQLSVNREDYVLMLDTEHKVLSRDFNMEEDVSGTELTWKGKKYKILHSGIEYPAFSLLVLRSQGRRWKNGGGIKVQFTVSVIVIILLCFGMALIQKRFFGDPIDRLVDAMNQLKEGNLDVRIREENVLNEFKVVNDAFDDMIREIRKLKIDVYEEKLNKQRAELLYLQEQINPHFLTNCMNLIRNLSILGENDKVQEAAVLVSNHMRYSLAYSTQVSLQNELRHVENYEKLQKMRYGDKFTLTVHQGEELDGCKVPTMLIQVFVENAIKHQLDPERQLAIEVRIWDEDRKRLHICIQDSGEGFSEDILQHLNAREKLINSEGEHIGIYNVCQRLEILYGESADILFSNGETGGARISIQIPFQV